MKKSKHILFSFAMAYSCLYGQDWKNMVPNYSFENVTNDYPRNDYNPLNITPFKDDDTTRLFKKENTTHSLNFQFLGPFNLSSIGYAWENQLCKKISAQLDFRISGHYGGYFGQSWSLGPSLIQSVLFGEKLKFKLGISEGIVFNPPSIRGDFIDFQPHDRPPRNVLFISLNVGVEFKLTKTFSIIPEAHITYLSLLKMKVENQSEQKIRISGFAPFLGLTLKINI